ncbi:MAG TPA: PAS domain-containing sensor histidine kinase [Acidimicrobiales bacterium]|nr:PAS domain-containing sensor histidine kinase [Acidimicrobiales bacterium]
MGRSDRMRSVEGFGDDVLDWLSASLISSPAATVIVGPAGRILRVNDAFRSLLGLSGAEVADVQVGTLVHPQDLPGGPTAVGQPLPLGRRELRWIRADGRVLVCLTQVWLISDPEGRPLYRDEAGRAAYWIHQLEDVSERYRLSDQLRRRQAEFDSIALRITDYAIFRLDADGRIASWNPGAERIKGYTGEEAVGRPYRICFLPEDAAGGQPEAILAQARRDGEASGEGWRRRKDGQAFWVQWTVVALDDEDGSPAGFVKITRDLTEQRAAAARLGEYAAELERSNHALREASRLQDDLLNVAHHEFRTPLAAVVGFADTLRTSWDRMSEEERGLALDSIASSGRSLDGLVENLIVLSSLHSARPFVAEPVSVRAAVMDAGAMAGVELAGIGVDVDEGLAVAGDPARVRQMLANLLVNAAVYGGGATEVSARAVGAEAVIEVADLGPGVPEDFVPELFGRFTQASRGLTRTARGAGLGLAVVAELCRLHGGEASHRPNRPTGARFQVRLPLVQE